MGRAVRRLLERAEETERLLTLLDRARDGHGGVAVIEAPAGLGKTSLLEALRDSAEDAGMRALTAIGAELERQFAFGACLQLFGAAVDESGADDASVFEGAASLARPLFDRDMRSAAPPDEDRLFALLQGLWWLSAEIAESAPLLLALDDAQWADEPSLRYVDFVSRRLDDLPIAVCLAVRSGEPGVNEELLRTIRGAPGCMVVRPGPLSEGAVGELVRAELGVADRATGRACAELTGGNPFYLNQLLTDLRERHVRGRDLESEISAIKPDSVARNVGTRIDRLGERAAELARAVAVLGDGTELRRAARLAGLDPEQASRTADRLAEADLLRAGERLSFAHPIVREAVYAELGPAQRSHAHGIAAELLMRESAAADQVAAQLLRTGGLERPWAVDVLLAAARRATSQGAHGLARDYLERALSEPPLGEARVEVIHELGKTEMRLGDPACLDHLRLALEATADEAIDHGSRGPLRAGVSVSLARTLVFAARNPEAIAVLREAISGLDAEHGARASELRADLLAVALLDLPSRRALAHELAEALETVEALDVSAALPLAGTLALEATLTSWPADRAAALAERVVDAGVLEQLPPDHAAALGAIATLQLTDRARRSDEALLEAAAAAERSGSARALAVVACLRSRGAFRWGRVAEAEEEGRSALRLATEHGWPFGIPTAIACVADPLIERGELEEASELTGLLDRAAQFAETQLFQQARECRARLELARGEPDRGLELALACGEWERAWGATNSVFTHYPWRLTAALAHLARSEPEQAAALATQQLEIARAFGTERGIGLALRIAGLAGQGDERVALLTDSIDHLAASPARLEHAKALGDLGAALRSAGRRRQAREPLYAALDLARRCGASAVTDTVRAELAAAGARPRREASSGAASLTPSERRVADLAAQGLGNRAIAQRLFLSRRTVETHLTNAYRKLEIPGREQLAGVLLSEPAAR
jgi:DNA-binding CsgD family transcriptional regulator